MRALVVGGSGSGKSVFAERLAYELSDLSEHPAQRIYLATMTNDGQEARERIERHRRQRAGLGFETVECTDALPVFSCAQPSGVVLLDDLGNLAANALFSADGQMADPALVFERLNSEIALLARTFEHTVAVGNLVGSEGRSPFETTHAWVRLIGSLCCSVAARFDTVVEVVAGIPHVVKGALPNRAALPSKRTLPSKGALTNKETLQTEGLSTIATRGRSA